MTHTYRNNGEHTPLTHSPLLKFTMLAIGIFLSLEFLGFGISHASASSVKPPIPCATIKYISGTGPDDAVQWDFFCTAGNNSGKWTKIRVPSCWEQEGFGTYYYGTWSRDKDGARNQGTPAPDIPNEQGKYRTTFNVPTDWVGQNVRIVFAGVMTDTEVLVNGKSAGSIHQGGFYQFDYDISTLLNYGDDGAPAQNTLEVNVCKESANISVNRAERRGDYWTFGGIYRPVWLEARPTRYIERVAIDAHADGTFSAEVFRGGDTQLGGTLTMQIRDAKNRPVGKFTSAKFVAGQTAATIRVKIPNPLHWTAETPNLYRAEFKYASNIANSAAHTYSQRFGFRTIEVRSGDGVYLNGQKIILKGVNRHSFRPETGRTLSREQCREDARLIKEMNMNAVRMSHYPPDSAFLEACDELGLYVIDELAGWKRGYDTPTGARLIGEMLCRDVNHPSIIFWANGNEGGWNKANDSEFAKWDPQRRNVLHPWTSHDNINTKHYPKYDELQKLCAGNEIFFPTEFLHGLYDGGLGAGFADYWRVMSAGPVCAGGFFWAFVDEGVVRTDEHGRIDNSGNLAPDGILGPHHERTGSFYAVKEIWSPVTLISGPDKNGNIEIQNNYVFTNLNRCTFEWQVLPLANRLDTPSSITMFAGTQIKSPNVNPGAKGSINLGKLPDDSIVYLRACDPEGRELWTWSWFTSSIDPKSEIQKSKSTDSAPVLLHEGAQIAVHRGALRLRFDKRTGILLDVRVADKRLPISGGPALAAYVRDNRRHASLLLPPNENAMTSSDAASLIVNAGVVTSTAPDGTVIIEVANPGGNIARSTHNEKNTNVIKTGVASDAPAGRFGKITWTIPPGDDAGVRLDYEYTFEGRADLLGVNFDVPESAVCEKYWLGRGPWRVYRNRLEGGKLGVHSQKYNDPLPGRTYVKEPEFKGYFRDWRWLQLRMNGGGSITIHNNATQGVGSIPLPAAGDGVSCRFAGGVPYIGLWRPRDGIPMMMEFPDTGIAFLDVIPAQGTKFDNGDGKGPQAATPKLSGKRVGSVTFHFE